MTQARVDMRIFNTCLGRLGLEVTIVKNQCISKEIPTNTVELLHNAPKYLI